MKEARVIIEVQLRAGELHWEPFKKNGENKNILVASVMFQYDLTLQILNHNYDISGKQ